MDHLKVIKVTKKNLFAITNRFVIHHALALNAVLSDLSHLKVTDFSLPIQSYMIVSA